MDDRVKGIVRDAIIKLIHDTASPASIAKSMQVHAAKTHFVPTKYRVLGGLLQSLNIKFGNFIEKLIALIVEQDANVTSIPPSGQRVGLSMTAETDGPD